MTIMLLMIKIIKYIKLFKELTKEQYLRELNKNI